MLTLALGLVMLGAVQAQCVKPDVTLGDIVCATDTPTPKPTDTPEATDTPAPTDTPTPEPTPTPTLEPTETPTLVPTDTPTPQPTQAPAPRPPVVIVTETPTPREQRTPRPTPEVQVPQTRLRPTLVPGPERARSPACLSAPPAVPDLPGVRDVDWTNEQRCGGTPEALATEYVVDRSVSTPDRAAAVVVVVILPADNPPAREPTETPAPERMQISPPASTDEAPPERPEVPVQLPGQ